MRLTVLGSGTCTPSPTRCSSGYLVEAPDLLLRLDCGAGTAHALARLGFDWEAITHQFISHFHIDHVGELPHFLFALKFGRSRPRTAPLHLIGPPGLRALVEELGRLYREDLLEQSFPVTFTEARPDAPVALDAATRLRVHPTPHTGHSLAVRIERGAHAVGYTGDTAPSDEVAGFFAGVDLLVAECSFLDDARGTRHLTADAVAALAAAARPGRLLLTHSYFDPAAAQLGARVARGFGGIVIVAEDGLQMELP